jgi:hypothetical protein
MIRFRFLTMYEIGTRIHGSDYLHACILINYWYKANSLSCFLYAMRAIIACLLHVACFEPNQR